MSERSKLNRKRREEKEEKQGNRVIMWIAVVLIFLAVLCMIWSMTL
ncbi:hypothetical protein [Prevotella histicola]